METTGGAINAAARKIKLELIDKNLTKNALATRAGIASTSFTRKLEHPEQFTLKDLGSIAQALEIDLTDFFQDAA
jgi:transcriptional regulator with XRE-family HTH domain